MNPCLQLRANTTKSISGRITELRPGTQRHSISVKCQYHQDCSVLRSAKFFRNGKAQWTERFISWLYEGPKRFPKRSDGAAHMKSVHAIQFKQQRFVFVCLCYCFVLKGVILWRFDRVFVACKAMLA